MRYVKIFLLHFQQAFIHKSISFVWFLTSIVDVSLIIFFWHAATTGGPVTKGWGFSELFSYYIFALIAGQFLVAHCELQIAKFDIGQGNLSAFLLKPFSYFTTLFFIELPWRLMNGSFSIVITILLTFFIKNIFVFTTTPVLIAFALLISIAAYFISFISKMILGIIAFWIIEMRGLFEAMDAISVILGGNLIPISLLPKWLAMIAYFSPFPYVIYFPIVAWEGKLSIVNSIQVFGAQIFWISSLFLLYQYIWHQGLKKFSAVGQ